MAGGKEPPSPSNPVVDIVTSGDAMTLVLLYSLVSIWAPVVEESIFRGALFRHLRSRMGVIAAAVASALLFGVMHGYEWMLLSPVIALGLIFAMMRDQRGSLIAPVVMHALHNGILMACMLVVLKLSGE
jgi:membrane protease YdiL (CAAX protease family)